MIGPSTSERGILWCTSQNHSPSSPYSLAKSKPHASHSRHRFCCRTSFFFRRAICLADSQLLPQCRNNLLLGKRLEEADHARQRGVSEPPAAFGDQLLRHRRKNPFAVGGSLAGENLGLDTSSDAPAPQRRGEGNRDAISFGMETGEGNKHAISLSMLLQVRSPHRGIDATAAVRRAGLASRTSSKTTAASASARAETAILADTKGPGSDNW
jgi:hypothetical protein